MEIYKFRAWSTEDKKMYYNIGMDEHENILLNSRYADGDYYEIMQYVGKEDTKGKNIYEGDIIQDDEDDKFEIIFDKNDCCFCAECLTGLNKVEIYFLDQLEEIRVIGNIYENKKDI